MPMYDFCCRSCQETFEDLVFDDLPSACPHCGSSETERLVSAPSPLKTGAFPYKIGPVMPSRPVSGGCASGACPGGRSPCGGG